MELERLLMSVVAERARQNLLWGTDFTDRDPSIWLAILVEEVGEVADGIDNLDELRAELVQVAAVALSWAEHVDVQSSHSQNGALVRHTSILGTNARTILEKTQSTNYLKDQP